MNEGRTTIYELFHDRTLCESPIPLYYQLQEFIKDKIDSGTLPEYAQLPSEREFSQYFGINRRTVSQAIYGLVKEGILTRKRGAGTYVAPRKIISNVNTLRSFHDEAYFEGRTVHTRLLKIEPIAPTETARKNLNLAAGGEKVFHLQRIGYMDDQPISIQNSYLPHQLFPGLDEKIGREESLYTLIEHEYGRELTSGEETLEATTISEYEADLLRAKTGSAAFVLQRVTFSHRVPVEYTKSILRGDTYIFKTKLQKR